MGARSIRMPDVGEGVAEAEIVEWSVKVGDLVREDQVVAAVMTDKATVEIPTPVAGEVIALGGGVGDVLAVGAELIRIDAPGLPDSPPAPPPQGGRESRGGGRRASRAAALAARRACRRGSACRAAVAPSAAARRAASAATRRAAAPPARSRSRLPQCASRAREAGVDLRFVRGTGPAGRITHDDLDAYIANPPEAPAKGPGRQPNLSVETVKVVGMRRRIAQNMAKSSRRVAHFSYVEEVDVTALEELRAALNARATEERPKLTMLPFLMLAIVKAVADFPQVNAHYDDDNEVIERFGAVHLGIATQTPVGLMVPVVRHAETLGLHEAAREMRRVSEAARQGVAHARGAFRLDDHADLARRARRNRLDAGRQSAGGGDRRRQQDRGEAGLARRRLRSAQDDEPVVVLRSPRRRRPRRRDLHPARARAARSARRALHRGLNERASLQGSHHRRRPRRLCRGDPRGRTRPRHGAGRGRPLRRHLPSRRLHSLEGDHPRRGCGARARRSAWR